MSRKHHGPSRKQKKRFATLDRYYARCRKVSKGHASVPRHEKQYVFDVNREYARAEVAMHYEVSELRYHKYNYRHELLA